MKRTIRPADEEINNLGFYATFMFIWYLIVLRNMAAVGISSKIILFLVVGLIPLHLLVRNVCNATASRKGRAAAIALGNASPGRITGVGYKDVALESGRSRRTKRYYFLQVEKYDPVSGFSSTIESQTYSKPVHKYLGSDKVTVYTDQTGWRYYLENFQYKNHKNDPDICPQAETFNDYRREVIAKVTGVIIMAFVLISII